MCGILGVVHFSNTPLAITEADILTRLDRMAYRGPDAQDQWRHPSQPVHLSHLRLSILDPRPEGTQPMHLDTCNGRLSMVFNGEVYNYLEIKEDLQALGYTFHTGTDSEVVLAAYAAWGPDCVHHFNGMFAIAIYNDMTKKLFLLRDRLGVKPLYYRMTPDGIHFSSEVKALHDMPQPPNGEPKQEAGQIDRPMALRHELLASYMDYGYIPGSETLIPGVERLLPGHYMTIHLNSSGYVTKKIERYWRIDRTVNDKITFQEAVDKGRTLLADALRLRMRADVPVGVFLSGGLDSSAVVAMLAQQLDRPIKTFSVRYDTGEYGAHYDESIYAEQVSKLFGTEHHTYTMTAEDFERYIPEFVRIMDEPVTEAAAISLHFVSELAKPHVTVVLSGEGSDEIFAGYDLYHYMQTLETLRAAATPLGAKFVAKILQKTRPQGCKFRKYAELAAMPFEQRYQGISVYDKSYHAALFKKEFTHLCHFDGASAFGRHVMQETKGTTLLSRMLEFDTRTWLVDDLLIKADRMSMASSLELRVPFLDYRMVEFAASLPDKFKMHKREGKRILKAMMKDLLPDSIIHREKRGFPTPLARMFKGSLRPYVQKKLMHDALELRFYFNTDVIQSLCKQHMNDEADHHRILWQLLVLEEWLQQQRTATQEVA